MLLHANAAHIPLADGSVHCSATSPPYFGLRRYSGDQGVEWPAVSYAPLAGLPEITIPAMRCDLGLEPTPEAYVGHLVLVYREVWRVLRDDATAWINLGDSFANDTKWGGSSGGKNYTSAAGEYQGQRQKRTTGLKPKDLCMIPARVALALQADGWWLRSDIIWAKGNPMPESVTDRPTRAHEYVFLLAKAERYWYDADAVREEIKAEWVEHYQKYAALPTINAKKNPDRNDGGTPDTQCGFSKPGITSRNARSVWHVNTQPFSGAHFATWPPALVERMLKASLPKEGKPIVLDPFAGSGTTGAVAANLGARFVGLDLGYTYLRDIAAPRLSTAFGHIAPKGNGHTLEELPLFASLGE